MAGEAVRCHWICQFLVTPNEAGRVMAGVASTAAGIYDLRRLQHGRCGELSRLRCSPRARLLPAPSPAEREWENAGARRERKRRKVLPSG